MVGSLARTHPTSRRDGKIRAAPTAGYERPATTDTSRLDGGMRAPVDFLPPPPGEGRGGGAPPPTAYCCWIPAITQPPNPLRGLTRCHTSSRSSGTALACSRTLPVKRTLTT